MPTEHTIRDECKLRLEHIEQQLAEAKETNIKLAVLSNDVSYIKDAITDVKELIENNYVTKNELEPIKKIVYGLTGLILTAVIIAVLSLVVGK